MIGSPITIDVPNRINSYVCSSDPIKPRIKRWFKAKSKTCASFSVVQMNTTEILTKIAAVSKSICPNKDAFVKKSLTSSLFRALQYTSLVYVS